MKTRKYQTENISRTIEKTLVLGLSVFGHDSSCTLVDAASGNIIYALTEERFSNVKHDGRFPAASLEIILEKILTEKLGRISHVALNIDPGINIELIKNELINHLDPETAQIALDTFLQFLETTDIFHPGFFPLNYIEALLSRKNISQSVVNFISDKISWHGNFILRNKKLKFRLKEKFPQAEIVSVEHHQCHAASAFYCSSFESAAVLTLDGQGEDASITLNMANGNKINFLAQTNWPNSLGALYMQLAWYLGFDGDDPRYLGFGDEFKVMGMAAYGKPIYADMFRKLGRVNELGQFEIIFGEYLELVPVEGCNGHSQPMLSKKFFDTLGERRSSNEPILQKHYDIACSGQNFLEEITVKIAKNLKDRCHETDNICIAGGVGLNGLMNMKILLEAGFKNIFIQPASGDDGTSLGAALHVYHNNLGGKRCPKMENTFLGLDYGSEAILSALTKYKLKFHKPKSIHIEMGRVLNEGSIVARYYGRGEFGPRALGNRSILANPARPGMKDEVNAKIKHREAFRPFAPACLEDKTKEYFDIEVTAPYMQLICKTKSGVREKIPAVVHDDNTARLQTVNEKQNPDLYQTILEFYKHSKMPILLNTSFNVNGESIVETPQDAIESFLFMGIDYLAIGPYLVSKEENANIYQRPSREEHIQARQLRYKEHYFSPEHYFWSTKNPIETELVLLGTKVNVYKKIAENRLAVIETLNTELKRHIDKNNIPTTFNKICNKAKAWVQ